VALISDEQGSDGIGPLRQAMMRIATIFAEPELYMKRTRIGSMLEHF
jgi:hypothetical protein